MFTLTIAVDVYCSCISLGTCILGLFLDHVFKKWIFLKLTIIDSTTTIQNLRVFFMITFTVGPAPNLQETRIISK